MTFEFSSACPGVCRPLEEIFTAGTCDMGRKLLGSGSFTGTFVSEIDSCTTESAQGKLDFPALVENHYAPLYRFAMSLTRAESDACDLVQQTFLIWATKGHQLHDHSKVKSWLFTSLHRCFLESQRRTTRFPHLELTEADSELPRVDPEYINRIDAQGLIEVLAQVDPQYKAAVALFYLEDYSYNEIARILEIPLGTVKSRIARGLGQLKQLLLQRPSALVGAKEKAS